MGARAGTGNPTKRVSPPDELVDVVDEEDRVTGQVSRRDMRARKLRHRASYVLVFNEAHQLFVHQRTASKDIYPAYYDVAAGGVLAAGEDYDAGARRELREELGIADVVLRRLFPFRFGDPDGPAVNGMVYSCSHSGPLRLQPSEVQGGQWMDLDDVVELTQRTPVCPDSLEALRLYLARLDAAAQRRR